MFPGFTVNILNTYQFSFWLIENLRSKDMFVPGVFLKIITVFLKILCNPISCPYFFLLFTDSQVYHSIFAFYCPTRLFWYPWPGTRKPNPKTNTSKGCGPWRQCTRIIDNCMYIMWPKCLYDFSSMSNYQTLPIGRQTIANGWSIYRTQHSRVSNFRCIFECFTITCEDAQWIK